MAIPPTEITKNVKIRPQSDYLEIYIYNDLSDNTDDLFMKISVPANEGSVYTFRDKHQNNLMTVKILSIHKASTQSETGLTGPNGDSFELEIQENEERKNITIRG